MTQEYSLQHAFGTVLRAARLRVKLSQEDLSLLSGLDRTYISLLERGLRQPTLSTLFVLARFVKVPAHRLVKQTEAAVLAGPSDDQPLRHRNRTSRHP